MKRQGEIDLALLLPRAVDNSYKGKPFARYFFYLITAVTIIRSCIHILAPDGGAQSIATIPLDSYSPPAAAAVVYLFAVWGLSQLLLGGLYLVVCIRYRSFIPLMYLTVFIEYSTRIVIGWSKPVTILGTAPGALMNYVMAPLALVLMLLSMIRSSGVHRQRR
ncbi:MAG: hypothetical protein FWE76_03860 [Symbiobacteriaceae bacterium]|nr:hypothetical protein [Symbiobacteriaceae bacterium]